MSVPNELSLSQGHSASTLHQTAFTWAIDHFSYRTDLWSPMFDKGKRTQTLFHLEPDVDGFLCLFIYPNISEPTRAKLKVSLLHSQGEKRLLSDKFHDVLANSGVRFPKLISRAELLKPSNGYLPGDTLTLHVELSFLEDKQNILKKIPGPSTVESTQKALEDYGNLLKSGNLADVKLLVGGKTLPAHKSILGARSPVFAAMFTHDTLEKQKGQVEIPDVHPEAFETLLEFLYTGAMPTLGNLSSAQELLLAADKYDATQLKNACEDYLISQMTIQTAPSLLLLGNSVNTPKLKERALAFISSHCSEFLDALKSAPEQLILLFQVLARKEEDLEKSK